MANKRERDVSQAKIETREAQRLISEVLIMATQWRDLSGRRDVALESCNVMFLNSFTQEFGFQRFVEKTIAFVPRIWIV